MAPLASEADNGKTVVKGILKKRAHILPGKPAPSASGTGNYDVCPALEIGHYPKFLCRAPYEMQVGVRPRAFLYRETDKAVSEKMDMVTAFREQCTKSRRKVRKALLCLPGTTPAQNSLPFPGQMPVGADADDCLPKVVPYVADLFPDNIPPSP